MHAFSCSSPSPSFHFTYFTHDVRIKRKHIDICTYVCVCVWVCEIAHDVREIVRRCLTQEATIDLSQRRRDGLSQIVTADARRSPLFSSSCLLRPHCFPRLPICYKLSTAVHETRCRIVTSLIKTEESRNDLDDISTTAYLPTYLYLSIYIYLLTHLTTHLFYLLTASYDDDDLTRPKMIIRKDSHRPKFALATKCNTVVQSQVPCVGSR